jgi:hypothetical protein
MPKRSGVEKVLHDAVDQAEPVAADAEQLTLIPENGASDARAPGAEKQGAGRPAGSLNRNTKEMVRYLSTFGAGPLAGLARIVNQVDQDTGLPDFKGIAKHAGVSHKVAVQMWMKAADVLAPYMHQKLPTAININQQDGDVDLIVVNPGKTIFDPESDPEDLLQGRFGDVMDAEVIEDENQ